MKCNEVLQHLNEYIENDLDESLVYEIKNHMEECSECRKVYEEEKELNRMFLEALNSEPIEFNSRIGNIMNMIDKDKYSSQKEENEVIEHAEDSKVIKFESVNKKKEKKLIFNKKIITMAATFTIMIFMAPFIIGEQQKDIGYKSKDDAKTRSFDESSNDSDIEYDMVSDKEVEDVTFIASVGEAEETKAETENAESNQYVDEDQGVDVQSYSIENANQKSVVEAPVLDKNVSSVNTIKALVADVEYLQKEYKIMFNNENNKTIIRINDKEEDLGIRDSKITSFVKENEYVYIACVGVDTEKESEISKIIKVNIKTNNIDIIYTSLKKEFVKKLELEEEKINFSITSDGQEKPQSIKK